MAEMPIPGSGPVIDPGSLGKVAVLMGGASAEREISLRTGEGVLAALRRCGVDAHPFDPADRPMDALRTEGFARAFVALHGRHGEDGTVQGALELLGVPYTGSGVLASAIGIDKIFTKRLWAAQGLPTPAFEVLGPGDDFAHLPASMGMPLMVKAPHEGSTLGITKVTAPGQLAGAIDLALSLDDSALVEQFIAGRELTVAILESAGRPDALPIVEIVAPDGNYDYQNKYFTDAVRYLCPAPLPPQVTHRIGALAVQAFQCTGARGGPGSTSCCAPATMHPSCSRSTPPRG
jgi:D-alanine-D-alanine ligase